VGSPIDAGNSSSSLGNNKRARNGLPKSLTLSAGRNIDSKTIDMLKLTTIKELLVHSIKDLYSAETQLVKALPKLSKAATDTALKEQFETHLQETKIHVERLRQVAELLGATPRGKSCAAMKGLVEEGQETIKGDAAASIKDLALIGAAQRLEHYEISAYGSARALAQAMAQKEIIDLLQITLDEELVTDEKLAATASTIISLVSVHPE
jgi:ferritin-like metal-binding protein YciE